MPEAPSKERFPLNILTNQKTSAGTAYDVAGSADQPCVVLIHGLGLSRCLWHDHWLNFAKSYRVIRYDLPGHGDSAPMKGVGDLTELSDQIVELLDTLEIQQAALVGFSIGGMINRRFALDHADRLSALAILNSPHDRGEEAQIAVEQRAQKVRDQGASATLDDALKRWFTPKYLSSGSGVERVRHWRDQVDFDSYAKAAWILANGVRELIHPRPPIKHPCLVMTCQNDSGSTPAMSDSISAEIAGSDVIIVPELQHLGLMEQPELFTKPVLNFLEGNLR